MTLFSRQELQALTQKQNSDKSTPCISIYIPTHEAGSEIQQDPIRLKNQLAEAEKQLNELGFASERDALLQPAVDLLENQSFWQNQKSGLAIFITKDFFQHYSASFEVDSFVQVGNRFYTSPLLPLITDDGLFYVLAASQNQVTLYQATRNHVQPVDLGETPNSLEVALRYDDPEESLQGHSSNRGSSTEIFHGQGSGKDSENTDILRFFHLVSDGVEKVLAGQTVPLVFMGVEFLFPIYQQANKYSHLVETPIDFQPDQLSAKEVRDKALAVVEPSFIANRTAESDRYGSLANQNQATQELAQIVDAAYNGQIDTLFVAKSNQIWGEFDEKSRTVTTHSERTAQSEDLLEIAVAQAIATNAKVHIVEADDMPVEATAAATLRYPIMREVATAVA